eukprot:3792071-Rhodomonas_salina.2
MVTLAMMTRKVLTWRGNLGDDWRHVLGQGVAAALVAESMLLQALVELLFRLRDDLQCCRAPTLAPDPRAVRVLPPHLRQMHCPPRSAVQRREGCAGWQGDGPEQALAEGPEQALAKLCSSNVHAWREDEESEDDSETRKAEAASA